MSNIATLPGTGDVHPDAILEMAKGCVTKCVVIGVDKDGDLAIWGSSTSIAENLFMVVHAQHWLISQSENDYD